MISSATMGQASNQRSVERAIGAMYTADSSRRISAYIFDSLLGNAFFLPIYLKLGLFNGTVDEVQISYMVLGKCYLTHLAFQTSFLYLLQATPGKMLMGLKVVSANDEHLSLTFFQALFRVLTDQLHWFFGLAPKTLALLRFDRTHLSDWVAETRVVQAVPRSRVPHRRIFVGAILFIVIAVASWLQAYDTMRSLSFFSDHLIYHP